MPDRPPVIGLAGGVGSGKSAVAANFSDLGCIVLDADRQVRELLGHDDVRDKIIQWWGERVLDESGALDRSAIASIVFEDEAQLHRLESLLHPRVIAMQREVIAKADAERTPAVVLDVPLLFEAGMDAECDAVLFIDAPEKARLERVVKNRGWDREELARRQARQWPLERKKAASDFVVTNDGDLADLKTQVERIFERIRSRARD